MYENTHAFYEKLQRSKNALLVKDDVGKPKQCTRNLPSGDHAYGVKPTPDAEGAGALLSSWSVHSAPKARPNERDFRKLNIMSVGKQCITPK